MMQPEEVRAARERLGELWGIGRDLTPIELARSLGLSPTNGNDHVLNMERGKSKVSGPIEILIGLYLKGAVPPDDVEIFKARGRRRIDPETGEFAASGPPPAPKRRRKVLEGAGA